MPSSPTLLRVIGGHYVDDDLVNSAFAAFSDFLKAVGFRTKHSTVQAPDMEHVLQGVSAKCTAEGVTLAPTAKIIQQLLEIIKGMLANHRCAPEEAQRLKSTLLSRPSSARGRAALGPIG